MTEPIYVIGHKNPDADSICSAIAYADFKTKLPNRITMSQPDAVTQMPG
ncbi:MAG: DHH family phosphoesterase [Verrucomicrobia bacterium]|nr:DHH family phosphoesterase [Verrucomicrobiota bacterium]